MAHPRIFIEGGTFDEGIGNSLLCGVVRGLLESDFGPIDDGPNWESLREFLNFLFGSLDRRQWVCSISGHNDSADCIRSIDIKHASPDGRSKLHRCDVGNSNGAIVTNRDDCLFEILNFLNVASATEEIFHAIDSEISCADFLI